MHLKANQLNLYAIAVGWMWPKISRKTRYMSYKDRLKSDEHHLMTN